MEDIWNITALVVSVLSVLLSLYALRQATTKNTSDMYLFFISQYAKEDMKLALRKLKDIKRGVYRLEQWESDMKNNLPKAFEYDEARRLVKYFYDTLAYMKLEKLIEARFVRLIYNMYLQLISSQYFISNKSGIWSLSLIVHSKG